MMMILVAYRMRAIKAYLKNASLINLNESDSKDLLKTVSILVHDLFKIIDLISKSFGIQMMIIFATITSVGMFAVFAGLQVTFNSVSMTSIRIYKTYKNYGFIGHGDLLIICFANSFIRREVIRNKRKEVELHDKDLSQVSEIKRMFRSLTTKNEIYYLPHMTPAFNCGLFAFDWGYFVLVIIVNRLTKW